MKQTVFLSLGSNVGQRRENLDKALNAISAMPDTFLEKVSDVMETPAKGLWDGDPGPFLNCCCRISTSLDPETLLDSLQSIERSLGRGEHSIEYNDDGIRIHSDRSIDIDILLYGNWRISSPRLQIPHPRMMEREFVTVPLRQIYPDFFVHQDEKQ